MIIVRGSFLSNRITNCAIMKIAKRFIPTLERINILSLFGSHRQKTCLRVGTEFPSRRVSWDTWDISEVESIIADPFSDTHDNISITGVKPLKLVQLWVDNFFFAATDFY